MYAFISEGKVQSIAQLDPVEVPEGWVPIPDKTVVEPGMNYADGKFSKA